MIIKTYAATWMRVIIALAVLNGWAFAQTSYQEIRRADPSNWLTYSGNYEAHRFSQLNQINRQNVARLKPTWVYQMNPGVVETTPIVVNGIMYVTEPPSTVTALDVRTGRPLWKYSPAIPPDVIAIGSPPVNRGVAILDNTVFVGTLHTHLVALDAKSGLVRWDIVVDNNKQGYYITSAPLAIDGKIIIGISGAETGIRGFIDAYDAKTGKRLWRTWSVPGPGEPGSETWPKNSSWKTGGGSTWLTGSYDPELDLLYWGTGNPAPDFNADERAGDNLYTCSLLALNPADGTIKWHFQFTPNDTHDWDANEIPVLFNEVINGRERKLVAMANRNGFYYVLDRQTGEFLTGTPFVKQTWADGLDAKGRPRTRRASEPSVEGSLVYPDVRGAANWWSPTYSPQTKLFYQAAREAGAVYFKGEYEYKPGTVFIGGSQRELDADAAYGAVRALEATTGKLKWEFRLLRPPYAGLMSSAGGLVFGGTEEGNFFALDAETGKLLWEFQLGAAIKTNPIAFGLDGTEYVAISAGSALFVFSVP